MSINVDFIPPHYPNYAPVAPGLSSPTEFNRPTSFDILPEVRNTLYEVLFHKPNGIRISPSRRFGGQDMFEDKAVSENLAQCLPFSMTCRQIYHEGASSLISNNTWIISRSLAEVGWDWYALMHQCDGAARWLGELGTLGNMVKKIVIDLDKTCAVGCHLHMFSEPTRKLEGVDSAINV